MNESVLPIFFLYGEPLKTANPDFVHIESLATRSQPSGWKIKPHKHTDLNHLILITEGEGLIFYESERIAFSAPRLLVVPAHFVHGFEWQANSDGEVLTIAQVHLLHLIERYPEFETLFREPRSIALPQSEKDALKSTMVSMGEELSWVGLGQSAAIEAGLLTILVRAARQVHHTDQARPAEMRQLRLVARYRQAVEQRFRRREPIGQLAKDLGVSLTTLREACSASGETPTEIRDQRAILEAQRLLAYSAATVAEVGEAIGISDPAYFSRFFSRKCGTSPDSWRRENRERAGKASR